MIDRLPRDVLVVALSRAPFASRGAVDATSRRLHAALRSPAFAAERARSGFLETQLAVAFAEDSRRVDQGTHWRSSTMRRGAPVRLASLPHLQRRT